MPTLRTQLQSGECGATWTPSESAEIDKEGERFLVLQDPVAKVTWQINESPFPFALDAAHDEVLRDDLEMSARQAFDDAWKAAAEGAPSQSRRTEDPTWSPVIEQRKLDVPGGTAVRLLRRVTYQPGNEIIAGHVIVPVATGHLDFCAMARASFTGLRESIVMMTLMNDPPGDAGATEADAEVPHESEDDEAMRRPFPPQAAYDDPSLDAQFPEHPLTVVRKAIDGLCNSVAITRPAAKPDAVVHLEEPMCAFAVPPRYVLVPPEVVRMHPTLRLLIRTGVGSWRRMLEVWRLDDVRFEHRDPRNELCAHAREVIAGWAREGATDIATEVEAVSDFGEHPQVQQSVRMKAEAGASHAVFRWWVEPDGIVFRIGSSGPPSIPDAEHIALLDGMQASWRRLDPVAPSHRPWWRIW
jgi:hypothetical protein